MRLVGEDLAMEGDPQRNLATFVTTWMEPEAQRIIAENLHTNFIDHAEYPISRRDRAALRADAGRPLPRAGRDHRLPHPGLVRGDHARGAVAEVEVEGAPRGRRASRWAQPNLVFGGDVHVVWEKFCRYFDVEPRIIPLAEGKYTIGPDDVAPHLDENTIGVVGVLGTTFTGHMDDIVGINQLLLDLKAGPGARHPDARRRRQRRLRLALPLPALRLGLPARAGAVDQRVRATSTAWSTPASAGSSSARSPTWPRTSCSTRTTSARPTRRSP